jgi:hypothetical protein
MPQVRAKNETYIAMATPETGTFFSNDLQCLSIIVNLVN